MIHIYALTILLSFAVECEEKMRSAGTSRASYYRTGIGLKAGGAPDHVCLSIQAVKTSGQLLHMCLSTSF